MYDKVTLLTQKRPVAVKVHKCDECGRDIEKGEKYLLESFVFEGQVSTHKTCRHCESVREYVCCHSMDGMFGYGNVAEDISDMDDGSWQTRLMLAGMKRKWKRKDGKMWRVF